MPTGWQLPRLYALRTFCAVTGRQWPTLRLRRRGVRGHRVLVRAATKKGSNAGSGSFFEGYAGFFFCGCVDCPKSSRSQRLASGKPPLKDHLMRSTRYTTCAIALAAALSMPAFAQGTGSGTSPGMGSTSTSADSTTRRDNDRGFDWGWLGLLGLAGLTGLRKKSDVHHTDTRTSVPR